MIRFFAVIFLTCVLTHHVSAQVIVHDIEVESDQRLKGSWNMFDGNMVIVGDSVLLLNLQNGKLLKYDCQEAAIISGSDLANLLVKIDEKYPPFPPEGCQIFDIYMPDSLSITRIERGEDSTIYAHCEVAINSDTFSTLRVVDILVQLGDDFSIEDLWLFDFRIPDTRLSYSRQMGFRMINDSTLVMPTIRQMNLQKFQYVLLNLNKDGFWRETKYLRSIPKEPRSLGTVSYVSASKIDDTVDVLSTNEEIYLGSIEQDSFEGIGIDLREGYRLNMISYAEQRNCFYALMHKVLPARDSDFHWAMTKIVEIVRIASQGRIDQIFSLDLSSGRHIVDFKVGESKAFALISEKDGEGVRFSVLEIPLSYYD